MAIRDLLAQLNSNLTALEAAVAALDIEPELLALDTRIVALTGVIRAKTEQQG